MQTVKSIEALIDFFLNECVNIVFNKGSYAVENLFIFNNKSSLFI